MISLKTTICSDLVLDDPFMIASSHHSDSDKAFLNLVDYAPAAITLKTISNKAGGAGHDEKLSRSRVRLTYPGGNRLGIFTDGPKRLELWDAPTSLKFMQQVGKVLPSTKVGISVAEGEDYPRIAKSLDLSAVAYVELNWKYTFRGVEFATRAAELRADLG